MRTIAKMLGGGDIAENMATLNRYLEANCEQCAHGYRDGVFWCRLEREFWSILESERGRVRAELLELMGFNGEPPRCQEFKRRIR